MRFSLLLNWYICRRFAGAFFGALGVIMGLIYLFDVVELMRRAATHGDVGLAIILEMALFKLPTTVQVILPFAVMIGAMIVFWNMTRSRELVVARSAGISAWQFLTPVLLVALVIGIFNVTAFNPMAATLYKRYQKLEDIMMVRNNGTPLLLGETGLWLRETHPNDIMVLHATGVRQEGFELLLRQVSVYISDPDTHFLYGIEAKLGSMKDGQFRLQDANLFRPGVPVEHFERYDFDTQLTMARVEDNFSTPETMSFWQLPGFISFFESTGFSASRQKLYFQSLLATPFLLLAMVLVAAVFSLKPNLRSGGILIRVVGGVVAGFVFYFISRVIYAYGLSQTLPASLAAWAPTAVASLFGSAALFHLEDG
jgi:lipopolysaccharide export system permease protein